jgi:hypothetical protein
VVPVVPLPADDVVHLGAVRRRLGHRAELLDRRLVGVLRVRGRRRDPVQLEAEASVSWARRCGQTVRHAH